MAKTPRERRGLDTPPDPNEPAASGGKSDFTADAFPSSNNGVRGVGAGGCWRPQTHAAAAARSHLSIISAFPGTLPCPRFTPRTSIRLPWTRNKEEKIERRRRSCGKGSKPTLGFLFRGAALMSRTILEGTSSYTSNPTEP